MERRKFFRNLAIGGSLLLTAPALFNACSNDPTTNNIDTGNNPSGIKVDLNDAAYAALQNVGGYAYKNDIIIIRSSDAVYIALSKLCTHSGCTVTFSATDGNIPCPCHGSKFTKEGAVVNGPAASPLKKYDVTLSGNILTIS